MNWNKMVKMTVPVGLCGWQQRGSLTINGRTTEFPVGVETELPEPVAERIKALIDDAEGKAEHVQTLKPWQQFVTGEDGVAHWSDRIDKPGSPHQYLTTDGNGKPHWEDKLAYEENGVIKTIDPKFLPAEIAGGNGSGGSSLPLEVGSNGKSLRTTWSAKEDDTYKLGQNAFAFGNSAKASGAFSIALGPGSQATGSLDFAVGASTKATGGQSHAEGSGSTASGTNSHAEGGGTTASGSDSHAEGGNTTASGQSSHAEGSGTTASGANSHAEGAGTKAESQNSHAEGASTTASGDNSHAEGAITTASGTNSHAEGTGTTASGDHQHVQGYYNIPDSEGKYAHIVGNGESRNSPSNAHTLDWDGNAWYAGYVEGTKLILPSPDGTRWAITVNNSGTLSAAKAT